MIDINTMVDINTLASLRLGLELFENTKTLNLTNNFEYVSFPNIS